MKKLILSISAIIFCYTCYSQFVDNKTNIYVGLGSGVYHGKNKYHYDEFIFPSLYNNFKNIQNTSLKGIFKKHKYLCIGIGADILIASNWLLVNNDYYDNSKIRQYSISPVFQIHNEFMQIGILNIFKSYVEVNPMIGISNFKLINHIVEVENEIQEIILPYTTYNLLVGISTNVGIEMKLSKDIGIFLEYSLNYGFAKSNLFLDKDFLNSQICFGLFLRFKKDKLYYY